ncbi:MAG: flagellar type III secretion system protein FlhB [Paracoccaceae bacterium]
MSEEDGAEKEHEPSQKKLDDARRRGEVVRSAELAVAASYGGLLIATMALGGAALRSLGTALQPMLGQAESLASNLGTGGTTPLAGMLFKALSSSLPFFALPGAAVLATLFAQRAIVFAPEKLRPKLSRIDPISNARQKFGRASLVEFAKSAVKLVLASLLLGLFLMSRMQEILLAQSLEPAPATAMLMRLMVEFLTLFLVVSGALGALDYLWQRHEHLRKNRMSRQELMDEMKQAEGDPQMRGLRRQRAEAIAMNRMLADVPKADVVIVNPTHYAVALRWERGSGRAPVCVAKGVDEVAARIREAAATSGVPVRSDAPTARALYASVDIGREVRPEHYAPVAAAIRFAETMRRRARERT